MKHNKIKMKRVLVIVSHPDDETIWMGGTLIRHKKDWDTTIICLCRALDKDRSPKFKKVCKILGVKCFISNLEDKKLRPLSLNQYKKIILKNAKGSYDYLFTHGKNGEYNHIRHKETHKAVKELLKQGKIKAKKVYFFSYLKKRNNFQNYAICNPNADIFIKLNHHELLMKRKLAINIHGYNRGGIGFEELSVGPIESFDKLR